MSSESLHPELSLTQRERVKNTSISFNSVVVVLAVRPPFWVSRAVFPGWSIAHDSWWLPSLDPSLPVCCPVFVKFSRRRMGWGAKQRFRPKIQTVTFYKPFLTYVDKSPCGFALICMFVCNAMWHQSELV